MLNEILEVEAYLCEVNVNDKMRILPSNLTGKYNCRLNGLQDILTLIAREFIFTYMKAIECTQEVHDACISALRLWCTFEDENILNGLRKQPIIKGWLKKYPYADGWLKDYYKKIIEPKVQGKAELAKMSKSIKRIKSNQEDMWDVYTNIWKERLVTPEEHLYSAKSFCYENILAEALADGPLKVRYLVFKGDEETFNNSLSKMGSKPSISTYRKNYKFIAAILLASERSGNQETIYLRKLRLLNWLGHDNDNLVSWFPALRWNNMDVCERFSGKNFVKLKLNKDFVDYYDIKLIDEINLSKFSTDEYTILEDRGHDVPLEKII